MEEYLQINVAILGILRPCSCVSKWRLVDSFCILEGHCSGFTNALHVEDNTYRP